MATIDEILKKYQKALTKKQIEDLIQKSEQYKLLNAGNRANAQTQLAKQYRQTRRGLQNMGLAGREGKLLSGREIGVKDAYRNAYGTYNQQLQQSESAMLEKDAARKAAATIRARQRQVELQQKAIDYEKDRLNQEQITDPRLDREKPTREDKEYSALVNYNPFNHSADENVNYYLKIAERNGMKGVEANRYAVSMAAEVANRKGAAAEAIQPHGLQPNQEQIQKNLPSLRFAQDYGVNLMKLKQEDPAMAQTIEDDVKYWYDFIDEKSEFWNNAIRNKTKDYHSAMQMQANAYAALAKLSLAAKAPAEQRQYYLMSDAEFDTAYDAAERAYVRAEQDYQIAKKDSSSTMDDVISEPKAALEKATQMKNLMDQIKANRASNSTVNLLAYQMPIPESAKTKDKEYASTREYVDENQAAGKITLKTKDWTLKINPWTENPSQNWAAVRDIGWSADDYAKAHDIKGSKYAALINEWSLINGRTAALFGPGQLDNLDPDAVGGTLDFIQALFGANRADTDVNYKWFRDECLMAFRGNYDDTGSSAQKEQMDAMLTLANLMTDEERARFNALLETMGAKAADDYFDLLYKNVLPGRFTAYVSDYNADYMDELPWAVKAAFSVESVIPSLTQGIPGIAHAYGTQQKDPNAAMVSAIGYNQAQNIRNARMQNIGKFGQMAYGTAMSMWDSYWTAQISGGIGKALQGVGVGAELSGKIGSALGGSLLGASAYNSTYQEGLERGLTPEKARMTALGAGINEMLFESLSLDLVVGHYKKGGILKVSKKALVNWIVNTLVQGGVEGSEEVFTDIGNNIWDKMVNGIYSEELTKIREYVSQGMTLEEAKRKVSGEFAAQLGMSFAGGFVSGGVMGGGATFLGMVQNRGNEKVGKGLRQNSRVMNELRNFDFKSEYAQEILQQKNLTNADIADLFNIMQQELLGRYKSDIQKAVADGKITQEQADLLKKYEQNGVQIVKDGKVVDNADGITVDQMPSVQDAIANLDNAARIQFLSNEETRSLVQAVGGETAAVIEQSETADREAERAYRQTIAEIDSDTTLTDEQKAERKEEAMRTRQNARSEAEKIADTALTNKKGIGAKLETDGNGTVKVGKGSGKVTYDFSTKDNPGHQTVDNMTATEQSVLRIAKIVAASRGDVNVKVEAEFVGEHANENGYYDRSTNTIHINMSGDNSVLWTLSHELTHHLANTDTEAYAALRTAIETALKDSKLTTTELEDRGFEYDLEKVDPYIAREGNLWDALVAFEREEHGYGKDAEEEVVARCCESFLGFDQFVKDFARKQYKSAKAVNKFIAQMNIDMQRVSEEARQSAAQRNLWNDESPENQILRQLTEIDRIANLWRIAVNAEAKKRKAARDETRASTKDVVKQGIDLPRDGNTNIRKSTKDKQYKAEFVSKVRDKNGYAVHMFYRLSERFRTDRTGEDAWKNEDIRFSLKDNVERKGDLIAVHNLSGDQLLRSIELGGFPMPSIAVMKQSQGHDRYGDVSVIFNKDTIDPKKSTANKVYGGDAWTPTYPTVEYKPRKNVADRIEKTYYDIARKYGYDAARPLYSYVYELERKLNNAGSEKALLDDLYNDIDIMRMYGQINGKNRVEDVYQEKRTEMSASDRAVPEYFIKTLGEKFIKEFGNTSGRAAFEYKKQFVKDHLKELDRALGDFMRQDNIDLEQATYVLENMTTRDYMVTLQRALNIINNNAVKVERIYDRAATEQAIKDSIDEKAYKEWIYDLFHGIIEKSGIRNNKSYYTDSGNQRSWDALHEDETLENVVRVMRDMTDKGSNAFFSQSEMLALGTRNFKSISDIREHKDQLQHISDEEMSAAKTDIVNRFGDLMDEMRDKSESNYFIGRDRALQAMVEAVRKSRTPQGILNELKQWHGLNVTDDMGRRIADLLDEIADLPTEYFEAKPRRAVGIDEIKAVIMPIGEYADLKSQLDERGIPVVEYEKDNAEDRLRALNSDAVSAQRFSIMDKVRLSTADGTRTYTNGDVTAKMYGNDVTLDGGKVRQRVQMMEAIAEVYGTARVDAASEEEAEAFRRAGAEQVVEDLEGHGAKYGTWEFKYEERKFTNDSRYDIKQKQKFAKDILKQVGKSSGFTQAQRVKYGTALGRLMDYLWEMQYGKMDGKVVFEFADRLFDQILNDYTALSEADEEFRSELLANMTKTKSAKGSTVYVLEVNDKQMREIKYAYENAMAYASKLSKALGARVTVKQTDNAKTLEDIFTNSTDTRIKSDTNEGDMPGELLRIAQETESRKTNPYAVESDERQALKMGMFEAAMSAAGVEKSTAQQIREAVKETRKAERTKAKTEARKAIDNARLAERIHEGALRAKDRRISENRERALKQHAAEREAKLKQGFRETTQKANETRLKRDMRTIALKWNQRLVKLLANPTEASHVPIQLAREVAELTKTITEYLDSGTERGRINLEKVIKAYQRSFADEETIAKAKAEDPHFDPRGLLPLHYDLNGNVIKEDPLLDMMNELNEIVAAKSFKDLSAYEMKSLLDIVRGVAHTVYDANRMIGTSERRAIWEVGDTMIHELEDAPNVKLKGYLETSLDLRRLVRIFSGSNDNAEFVKLVERLNDGAIEKERIAQVLQDIFAPVTEKYGDEIRKWYGKKAEWIDTGITQNGKKVEITKGMRVSLAMHVLNAGNMNHIATGGITIPNREQYNKGKMTDAYANGETVQLSAEQIEEIISHMTEAEKAYVEAAKEFFHKRTGYYVNKTSLQLLGYRKATVENYFPIHTDKNFTKTDFASLQMDGSIEGQGFLKERKDYAGNPVYLEDITSVVNRQIRGVALYAGLAVPMRNFNAVMNSTEYFEDENGAWRPRTTVRKAMTQKMGDYGMKVVKGFLEDASEMTHVDVSPMERFAGKLATNYVKAVLLGNLKVAMKQVASYPTAAAVIPWKYLGKALTAGKVDIDLINQYTPLYRMRREGQANEISSIMAKRGLEQKLPWLLGWITKMDVATVGRIWKAAEYMVADQQKDLPVGSDEYYKAVAKVFNDTVQQTQPNFTPLQRNAALRSKNPIVRSLVLFGTQRMQNGGILIEAAMELKQSKGKSKAEIQAARRKLGRAVASQIVQNILLIVASLGVDALRGRMKGWQDEDKEITAESLAKGMGDMFLSNFIGSFLGGSETYSLISGLFKKAIGETAYDTEFTVPALDAVETLINFAQSDVPDAVKYLLGDHTDEEKQKKAINFSYQLAKAFGYATGIPLENALKDVFKGIIPAIEDIRDAVKTGELNPWLHQSGKLDKKTTNANYKEWTSNGFKGSEYFYWENVLSEYGKRDEKIPILLDSDLPDEKKAMLLRMMDKSGATSEGTKVYKSNGDLLIDFANPTEKQQALPMPETVEPTVEPTAAPSATPKPTENPLSEAKQEGVREAVAKGVAEQTATEAFLTYQNIGAKEGRDDEFREWLFKNVDDPHQRAVLDYQVIGRAAKVEGAVTYKDNGTVYRDYTDANWYKLSNRKASSDGTNKRYEAAKKLEKTGLTVDKTVSIYDELDKLTKKAEWTEYLKSQNMTDEQINLFLWSRGWAKLK